MFFLLVLAVLVLGKGIKYNSNNYIFEFFKPGTYLTLSINDSFNYHYLVKYVSYTNNWLKKVKKVVYEAAWPKVQTLILLLDTFNKKGTLLI